MCETDLHIRCIGGEVAVVEGVVCLACGAVLTNVVVEVAAL